MREHEAGHVQDAHVQDGHCHAKHAGCLTTERQAHFEIAHLQSLMHSLMQLEWVTVADGLVNHQKGGGGGRTEPEMRSCVLGRVLLAAAAARTAAAGAARLLLPGPGPAGGTQLLSGAPQLLGGGWPASVKAILKAV